MRMNKKGVTELPVKLLIIAIILSVSLPVISDSFESGISKMDSAQLENESRRITDAAAASYYSADGDSRFLELDIPEGCSLMIGGEGEDSYSIRMYYGSEEISKHWMEKPMIPFSGEITLEGRSSISVTADNSGIRIVSA